MNYDICSGRPKKDGGTYWHKIGVMFPNAKGGFSIKLDSLPVPNEKGEVWVSAFEQKARENAPARGDDLGDEVPF